MSKFKVGSKVATVREFDFQSTGGPLIPEGTEGIIRRRYQGEKNEVWVNFSGISYQSRFLSAHLIEVVDAPHT